MLSATKTGVVVTDGTLNVETTPLGPCTINTALAKLATCPPDSVTAAPPTLIVCPLTTAADDPTAAASIVCSPITPTVGATISAVVFAAGTLNVEITPLGACITTPSLAKLATCPPDKVTSAPPKLKVCSPTTAAEDPIAAPDIVCPATTPRLCAGVGDASAPDGMEYIFTAPLSLLLTMTADDTRLAISPPGIVIGSAP